jgi:hypothetical protein
MNKTEALSILGGFLGGIALDYLWERFKGPGYEVIVTPMGKMLVPPYEAIYLGRDDVYELIISSGVAVGGYALHRKGVMLFGLGMDLGVLTSKLSEYFIRGGITGVPPTYT